ncbi:MAG: O-antigen ligase domain-containing protein, partial [Proteobacteria bacterium]|nr:O-antigen ligase domain-containing protein [Pseudomonadota bacterium]
GIFSSQRFQQRLARLLGALIGLLLVSLAVAGSLSRAAWLAVSIGLLGVVLLDYTVVSQRSGAVTPPTSEVDPMYTDGKRRRRRSSRATGANVTWATLRSWSRPVLFTIAFGIFLFFMNERGRELLADRIEYGLMHSKDDIRWEMYRDTMPAIGEHFWLGVGLGNWEPYFKHSIDPRLAGLSPVYLHSDPLQLLAETGLVGTLPLILLFVFGSRLILRRVRELPRQDAVRLVALLLALWSVLIASCFDFPFRIPAFSLQFSLLLAVICSTMEDVPVSEAKVLHPLPSIEDLALRN